MRDLVRRSQPDRAEIWRGLHRDWSLYDTAHVVFRPGLNRSGAGAGLRVALPPA